MYWVHGFIFCGTGALNLLIKGKKELRETDEKGTLNNTNI